MAFILFDFAFQSSKRDKVLTDWQSRDYVMETKARNEVAMTQKKAPMSINSLSNGFFLVTSLSQ